jgi:hypothetical protein
MDIIPVPAGESGYITIYRQGNMASMYGEDASAGWYALNAGSIMVSAIDTWRVVADQALPGSG